MSSVVKKKQQENNGLNNGHTFLAALLAFKLRILFGHTSCHRQFVNGGFFFVIVFSIYFNLRKALLKSRPN